MNGVLIVMPVWQDCSCIAMVVSYTHCKGQGNLALKHIDQCVILMEERKRGYSLNLIFPPNI